jgi:hypothetical protein
MISFQNSMQEADAEAIRAFLTARANELKRNPPRQGPGPGVRLLPSQRLTNRQASPHRKSATTSWL